MTQWDTRGATVWPTILVGASPGLPGPAGELSGVAAQCLVRVEVDTQRQLPGVFTLVFEDLTGAALDDAGLDLGVGIEVWAGPGERERLIVGEITAIEGHYQGTVGRTVVRGYDRCHRLQRARRARSFDNVTDADIAELIAAEAGLAPADITATTTRHEHVLQCNQTDWEFLAQRAAEIGFEIGIQNGVFRFCPAASVSAGSDEGPLELDMPGALLRFEPRISAGSLTPDVEVRVWDPLRAALAVASPAGTRSAGASAAHPKDLSEAAKLFLPGGRVEVGEGAEAGEGAAVGDVGPEPGVNRGHAPSATAHVVGTLPVADAEAAASALAASAGGAFAEAEGDATGHPGIRVGAAVKVSGIPGRFPDVWLVTRARHVFDLTEYGYHTEFAAGGPQDRSLLGLASSEGPSPVRVPGLVCGLVDDIGDKYARVRVTLPWLSPDVRTDWAPVVQFGAGPRSGAMFLPEVGDQVLVGFEFGDPRRPYVLGGLVTENRAYDLGGSAVRQGDGGADTSVARRGFVSASGNRLVFHDEVGDVPEPQSRILLGTGDGRLGLDIDAVGASVELSCDPADSPKKELTIRCGDAGTVNIVAGPGGKVNIDGGDELTLNSTGSLTIRSQGSVSVSGASVSLGG
ncbi:phage baseplate assembly protein V [Streptacidiphilus anmyonensis]|uniref:phage baseplate assembly protein V n=1 Tax=Streptacidiphilus anmyonensis TaxID=405782 RepID=UPI0005AB3818|nr:phage baseplate assembly protein V [Streptacidiphilus anmyonensis]